jgi:hypothetical protein
VAEQTQEFYRNTDPANIISSDDYPSQLKKTFESYGSLSATSIENTDNLEQHHQASRQPLSSPSTPLAERACDGTLGSVCDEGTTVDHSADVSVEPANDPVLVDWSSWGLQSLFPQDPESWHYDYNTTSSW